MGKFADEAGFTPLEGTGLVDQHHIDKLKVLSVTSVEEMLSVVEAAPDATLGFMEGTNLAQLQADAGLNAPQALQAVQTARSDHEGQWFALGAREPDDVSVETTASAATFEKISATATFAAPDEGGRVDLLESYGPIRSQGNRGTCVGHAGAAILDCLHHTLHGVPGNLSPQFLFYSSKQVDGHEGQDGTWAKFAIPSLHVEGICNEPSWPYEPDVDPASVHHGPPPGAAIQEASGLLSTGTEQLDPRDSSAIRSTIDTGKPVLISVPVYQNWWGPITKTTGKIPMPLPNSVLDGGHAMCVVGYDYDEDFTGGGYLILRNSWGTAWANQSPIAAGYGAIPFAYIDQYGWEAFTVTDWPV